MEICEQQTFPGFEAESQFCPQACRASQAPWPGSAEAIRTTVGSGAQCSMLLEWLSLLGAFSRILLESSHWTNSGEFSYVWNRLDTKFALSAFQLTPLEQSIEDSGCSLWRTPNASVVTGGGQDGAKRMEAGHAMQLSDQVLSPKLWPTPRKEGYDSQGKGHGDLVYEVKARLFPTSGSLNPRFVEELMGFPIDHTALKRSGTLSSRNRSTLSWKQSTKSK
jgi:hypothetical protein